MDPFKQAGFDFVLTEIQVGLTFATLALQAEAWDSDKIHREVTNARKAYDNAVHFQKKIGFNTEETNRIEQRMKVLRAALEKLDQRP